MRFPVSVLLLVLASTVHAQHQEQITVEVVNVPVYVRRGLTPVTKLTRDNFELFVNGKRQPIDYFDVVDLGAAPESPSTAHSDVPPPLEQRRLFLFVFDLYFAKPHAIGRAKQAATELVLHGGPSDLFAVATFTSGDGIRIVTPFTKDRDAIARAIVTLRPSSADDPLRMSITDNEREFIQTMTSAGSVGNGEVSRGAQMANEIEDPFTGGGSAMQDNRIRPIERVAELQIAELRAISGRVAAVEGQKHVVLLSEGFPAGFFIAPMGASSYLHEQVQKLYRDYHAAGTFLHTLDIAGLRHTFTMLENETLHVISSGTGGQFLHNTNSLSGALTQLSEQHRYEYLLGFHPREPRRGYNRIVVRLKGVGRAQLTYRRGFSTFAASEGRDGLRLADVVMNDIPQIGLASAMERTASGLKIVIPARAAAELGGRGEVELLFYVFAADNTIIESRRFRLPVEGKERTIAVKLNLPAGRYVAKVLLRTGESFGLTRFPLEVRP